METPPRTPLERIARGLLTLAVACSFGVAAWLGFVLTTVLPARDPAHLPLWAAVALGFAAYGAVSAWQLARPQQVLARWALALPTPVLIALGCVAVGSQVDRAARGGEFEGYVLLMGAGLVALALAALLHLFATQRPRRRALPAG